MMNMPLSPTEPPSPDVPGAADAPIASNSAASTYRRNSLISIKKLGNPWLLAALLVAGLATWQWLSTRHQLQQIAISNNKVPEQNGSQQTSIDHTLVRLQALEEKVNSNILETGSLQAAYRDISNNHDAVLLAEVEHALVLANQQLQINGNISTAIAALQLGEQRLNRENRPEIAPVHKAIKLDLERLRSHPNTDFVSLAQHIDTLIVTIDTSPLAVSARPQEVVETNALNASLSWDRFWQSLWRDLQGLVRIERMDTISPLYLPPEAQFFVRENIKLRLLTARLSLLARNQSRFKQELNTVQNLLTQHFDVRDPSVQKTIASVAQLSSNQINLTLPNLQDSLHAVRLAQQQADKRVKP